LFLNYAKITKNIIPNYIDAKLYQNVSKILIFFDFFDFFPKKLFCKKNIIIFLTRQEKIYCCLFRKQ